MESDTRKDDDWKKSTISRKYPTYRKILFVNVHTWLAGKRVDDEAEGLWRIHDTLYDLESFIDRHPGGAFWIRKTKGTDITELFESHHISKAPELMLEKFKVREAANPRNMTLTFKEDGFYKTLKGRVREKMHTLDNKPSMRSDAIHTSLLVASFLLSIASVQFQSKLVALLAGVAVCWTVIASHNYFHRKDNWRMYAFNLGLMNFNDWRVSHAMSHHMFTNSYNDLELSLLEPFLCWIPNPHIKNKLQRFGSWVYGPTLYALLFKSQLFLRIIYSFVIKNILYWDDLITLTLPLVMLITSDIGILSTLKLYLIVITASSFTFSVIGLNAAHHAPQIFHDGDYLRLDRDWGLYQLDAVMDRSDSRGSQFMVLTQFGDHALHHLFPTIDHGLLPKLYPILYETMAEFKTELRECPMIHHIIGQHLQLARIVPNTKRPGEKV